MNVESELENCDGGDAFSSKMGEFYKRAKKQMDSLTKEVQQLQTDNKVWWWACRQITGTHLSATSLCTTGSQLRKTCAFQQQFFNFVVTLT